MSYQSSIRTTVQFIVEGMGLSFLCETPSRANVALDKFSRQPDGSVTSADTSLPCALFIQPTQGTMNVQPRFETFTDSPRCALAFLQAMPLDFTGADVERVQRELQALAAQFIANANASGYFEPIEGSVNYEIGFDRYDANLLVFTIYPTLKEAVGQCVPAGQPDLVWLIDEDLLYLVAPRQ